MSDDDFSERPYRYWSDDGTTFLARGTPAELAKQVHRLREALDDVLCSRGVRTVLNETDDGRAVLGEALAAVKAAEGKGRVAGAETPGETED